MSNDLPAPAAPEPQPPSEKWWSSPRAVVRSLLQLDDTPHSIALGSAIGMWIALTPTVGIQMIEVMIVAFLTAPFFRWNRIAAILMVYVSNPVTMIPLYWFNYKVGTLFVGGNVSYDDLKRIITPTVGTSAWDHVKQFCVDLGWPLLIGSLVVCTVCAIPTYPMVLWLVKRFREPKMDAVVAATGLTSATAGERTATLPSANPAVETVRSNPNADHPQPASS